MYTYVVTADMVDANKELTIDFSMIAEEMEFDMRDRSQNYLSEITTYPVKIVNESGVEITYKDYAFTTHNWIKSGELFSASATPAMKNQYNIGWGEAWQAMVPFLVGTSANSPVIETQDFEGENIRLIISPLRCINPAIVSFFKMCIRDREKVSVSIRRGGEKGAVTLDGQEHFEFSPDEYICLTRSKVKAKFLKTMDQNFFALLEEKFAEWSAK